MSIKRRIGKLEEQHTSASPFASIPWSIEPGGPKGTEIAGEFLTWDEIAERYPDAPVPLAWDGRPA